MGRLEAKRINNHTYYYYSEWGWKDGKCRRLLQKYLGKPETILKAVKGKPPTPAYAEVFEWGLSSALWQECKGAQVIEIIDELCPKRSQGLSTGQYIALAGINRAMSAVSKASMWEWFSQTVLLRYFPQASKAALTSQRFWDHMDKINAKTAINIWKRILSAVVEREKIDLSSVSYDGTNFYTFIDTFNARCHIAKRGKNKQGRCNLRQVSYALFCSSDNHIPIYYDTYDGNRNDAKQFPLMLSRFHAFLEKLAGKPCDVPNTTLIFDKGNNSADNFGLLDSTELKFVGSVKLDEHKDLATILNDDDRFVPCTCPELEKVKAYRTQKVVYGKERTLVVTYNQNLFTAKYLTLQNDISHALSKLAKLQDKLEDRRNGIIKGGKTPSLASVQKQCNQFLSRQHLKRIVTVDISKDAQEIPKLNYQVDTKALDNICNTYLGKNILLTNQAEWENERIIRAYRSQFIIEDVFKEMKDRNEGSWWPLCHWTDSKIRVHALYCTIALLLRALTLRRVRQAGIIISLKRLLKALRDIREVIAVYPQKSKQKKEQRQTTLTKLSELQQKVLRVLGIKHDSSVLG